MDDIEKNRSEYVVSLEERVRHLQRQFDEVKPLADKWTPIAHSEMGADGARITLSFGGKRVTATIGNSVLTSTDLTTLTSSVIDTLCESLIVDRLKEVVTPEVERLMRSQNAIAGAGKW